MSPLPCASSVSDEVRAWDKKGKHTGPRAGASAPVFRAVLPGASHLSDPPSKKTHYSPHCPIDQNSVASVFPQGECWSLVGATTTETYFGQPGLVLRPLGGGWGA